MEYAAIVTAAILKRLPASEGWNIGDEIIVEYEVEWDGHFGTFCRKNGEAIVSSVEYLPVDESEPIDLADLIEPEIDGEIAEDARVDAEQAYGDYLYDCMKDRQFES